MQLLLIKNCLHDHSLFRILYTDALGVQQYATNSLLFLRIIQDKYISLYRELITQLHTYISAKGYLPNTLITTKEATRNFIRSQEFTTYHKSRLYLGFRQITPIL